MNSPTRRALIETYDKTARRASGKIIAGYSSSFSLATRLLAEPARTDIRHLYAVVRIADEIVDGTALEVGANPAKLLNEYEEQVRKAAEQKFHTDPVMHAFAMTARRCNFKDEHLRAFFTSMRRDLDSSAHDAASFDSYVYGSAEVIGLLCLDVFLADRKTGAKEREQLDAGARHLGAAFQKINFLRDRHEDFEILGREYFPEGTTLEAILSDIRDDIEIARTVIPGLPLRARAGVLAATGIFEELTSQLADSRSGKTRISVPRRKKLGIAVRAAVTALKGNNK